MEQSDEAYLFSAIENNDFAMVLRLIEKRKVNPNCLLTRIVTQKETQDYTALYLAASLGRAKICRYLLSKGAEPFSKMVFGMFPVHIAADRGLLDVLKVLLEVPGSASQQDDNGDTPLHLAALRGHSDCVIELVTAKADLFSLNHSRRTPLEEARRSQKTNIVNYLNRQSCLARKSIKSVIRTQSAYSGMLDSAASRARKEMLKEKSKSFDVQLSSDHSDLTQSLPLHPRPPITVVTDTYVHPNSLQRTLSFACTRDSHHTAVASQPKQRPHSLLMLPPRPEHPPSLVLAPDPAPCPAHNSGQRQEGSEPPAEIVCTADLSARVTSLVSCLWEAGQASSLGHTHINSGPTRGLPHTGSNGEHCRRAMSRRASGSDLNCRTGSDLSCRTGSDLSCRTGSDLSYHSRLLSASSELMVGMATGFGMSVQEAKCLLGRVESGYSRPVEACTKLTKGWDYFVLRESPVHLLRCGGGWTAHLRVQMRTECPLHIPRDLAVLKIVAREHQTHHLEPTSCYHGYQSQFNHLLKRKHPHICQVYTSYHGNLEGFQQHLDPLQMAAPGRWTSARFSLLRDHASSLQEVVDGRRPLYPEPPHGLDQTTLLAVLFQLFTAGQFLEENGCPGLPLTLSHVLLSEGLAFLDIEDLLPVVAPSNQHSSPSHSATSVRASITELFSTLLSNHGNQSLSKSFWSLLNCLVEGNTQKSVQCSKENPLVTMSDGNSFGSSSGVEGNSPMTSFLAAHLCYALLAQETDADVKRFSSLDCCHEWLFTQRLSMHLQTPPAPKSGRGSVQELLSTGPFVLSRLRYEYVLIASPCLMWEAQCLLEGL